MCSSKPKAPKITPTPPAPAAPIDGQAAPVTADGIRSAMERVSALNSTMSLKKPFDASRKGAYWAPGSTTTTVVNQAPSTAPSLRPQSIGATMNKPQPTTVVTTTPGGIVRPEGWMYSEVQPPVIPRLAVRR